MRRRPTNGHPTGRCLSSLSSVKQMRTAGGLSVVSVSRVVRWKMATTGTALALIASLLFAAPAQAQFGTMGGGMGGGMGAMPAMPAPAPQPAPPPPWVRGGGGENFYFAPPPFAEPLWRTLYVCECVIFFYGRFLLNYTFM